MIRQDITNNKYGKLTAVKFINKNKWRSSVFYTRNNETKTLKQWAEFLNVDYKKVWNRINILDWSFDKALMN